MRPRINFMLTDTDFPFKIRKRQYPNNTIICNYVNRLIVLVFILPNPVFARVLIKSHIEIKFCIILHHFAS